MMIGAMLGLRATMRSGSGDSGTAGRGSVDGGADARAGADFVATGVAAGVATGVSRSAGVGPDARAGSSPRRVLAGLGSPVARPDAAGSVRGDGVVSRSFGIRPLLPGEDA